MRRGCRHASWLAPHPSCRPGLVLGLLLLDRGLHLAGDVWRNRQELVIVLGMRRGLGHDLGLILPFDDGLAPWHHVATPEDLRHGPVPPSSQAWRSDMDRHVSFDPSRHGILGWSPRDAGGPREPVAIRHPRPHPRRWRLAMAWVTTQA